MAALHDPLTFESGSVTGSDGFEISGNGTLVSINPISGTYSVQLGEGANSYISFTDTPSFFTAFYFRFDSFSDINQDILRVQETSSTKIMVNVSETGMLQLLRSTSATVGSAYGPLVIGTVYRLELEYQAATGAGNDGIVRGWIAEGDDPSTLLGEYLINTQTSLINRLVFQSNNPVVPELVIDDVHTDDSEIPSLLPGVHEADVQFDFGFGIEQHTTHTADVQFDFGFGLEATTNLIHAADVQFDFGFDFEADAKGIYVADVQFDFGIALRDNYTGPGTGVVTTGEGMTINKLREGDTFNIYSPLAGIEGIAGPAHVNTRTSREDRDEQDLDLKVFPQPDPSMIPELSGGGTPRITPTEEQNFATKMRNQEREIRKLKKT